MIFREHNWWWKQLNGPIISAVTKAFGKYFLERFGDLNKPAFNSSIAVTNGDNLRTIGKIMGVPWLVVQDAIVVNAEFKFTLPDVLNPFDKGFSGINSPIAGLLGGDPNSINPGQINTMIDMAIPEFRRLLLILGSEPEGSRGLRLLDKLCAGWLNTNSITYRIVPTVPDLSFEDSALGDFDVLVYGNAQEVIYPIYILSRICLLFYGMSPIVHFYHDGLTPP